MESTHLRSRILLLSSARMTFLLLVLLGTPFTWGLTSPKSSPSDHEGAASEPAAAIAEPNLGALLGLGNPINSGNHAALLKGLGGHSVPQGGAFSGVPNLQSLRDSGALGNICNSHNNGGNSDALTNLLVYQYLSGSLPAGGGGAAPMVSGNPQLQVLLEGSRESKTQTSVTTTLTTRTITMEGSTQFSTSTTSYVTTITSLTSSVLPIIFRGSKITTTITDRKTEILTATEFHTSSSVLTPSVIQTLNVEVTLLETSTKGLNGHFTLARVNPGASKVIEKPISQSTVGYEQLGISQLGLGQGDNSQVVNALTALLQKYNDDPEPKQSEAPRGRERGRGRNRERNRNEPSRFGNTRFHTRSRFSPQEEDTPKFNVIRGFTLSDQPAAEAPADSGSSGTALENTRYSKFRKKNNVQNNSLGTSDQDRESERFSASTSRRTVSRARESQPRQRSRFQTNPETFARTSGVRTNRNTERNRRRSGRTLEADVGRNIIKTSPEKDLGNVRTTLLTMHISGVKPGETKTTIRTVTLRGLGSARFKRQTFNEILPVKSEPMSNTQIPDVSSALDPEEVVRLLKNLDKSTVRRMLHSLHDWVDYYLHKVLDETIEPSFFSGKFSPIEKNNIPELFSSKSEEDSSSPRDATMALASLPNAITGEPVTLTASAGICPEISVVTETVYQTLYKTNPH